MNGFAYIQPFDKLRVNGFARTMNGFAYIQPFDKFRANG